MLRDQPLDTAYAMLDAALEAQQDHGMERIDHGIRCLEDDALVARLVADADAVPLTVCPLSKVRLRVIDTVADPPLRAKLDRGLRVTINSDDPAYFGGYLHDNLAAITSTHGLGRADLEGLALNSVAAAFLSADERSRLTGTVTTTSA